MWANGATQSIYPDSPDRFAVGRTPLDAVTDAVNRLQQSHWGSGVALTRYGATTTGYQRVLTEAREAGGGIVFVPPGVHTVDAALVVGSNTVLRGAGPRSVLRRDSGLADRILLNAAAAGHAAAPDTGIVVRDLALDGNHGGMAAWVDGRDLLYFSRVDDGLLQNVTGDDALNDGLILEYCRRTAVVDCHVSGCRKVGVYLSGCDHCAVRGGSSRDNGSCGYAVSYCWWCTVEGVDGPGDLGNASLLTGRGTRHSVFAHNRLRGFAVAAEVLATTAGPLDAGHPDNYTRDGTTQYGIDDCLVVGNILTEHTAAGLSLTKSHRVTAAHNLVWRNAVYGVNATGCRDLRLVGNRLSQNGSAGGPWGIVLETDGTNGTTNAVVEDNHLQDERGTVAQWGISVGSTCTGTRLRRNRVEDAPGGTRYFLNTSVWGEANEGGDTITVAAGTGIRPWTDVQPLTASGGDVTMTATPTVEDGVDGQRLVLLNVGGTNTITLQDQGTLASSNLRLVEAAVTLGPRQGVELVYSAAVGDWVQVSLTPSWPTTPTVAGLTDVGDLTVLGAAAVSGVVRTGQSGTGTGGNIRHVDDGGTVRWLAGIGGSAGARDWLLIHDPLGAGQSALVVDDATRYVNAAAGFQVGGGAVLVGHLTGTTTWDPPNLTTAAETATTLTVTGAALGDVVGLSFSNNLQGMVLHGHVSAADTVTAVLRNGTGGSIDLASGTLRAVVWKY